ncbi:Hachiman antiphage defense system protein HamA [Marinifilum fragile]|uniref:Hachiman antiphage defense system protein HamA n=1 Tax=Marinifilum fragile TaxID=570161 RepID=UPI002AABE57A|nr:Hachiman antiphage defense system protein HamA [Marinifilum fragile]
METKIGELLAVRINSYRKKGEENYGSGVIYPTKEGDYDLIFTAKHCICRKDVSECKKNICDNCLNPDFTLAKLIIDHPENPLIHLKGKDCMVFFIEDRDFAVVRVPKLEIENIPTPDFTDKKQFGEIDGWGFPQINNASEITQFHFKEVSKVVNERGKMWLPITSNTTADLQSTSQDNVKGFSGAGIFGDNKYLVGIYTDTQNSANGKGVIIDDHINQFLIDKGLENISIEDNTQIIKTRINEEFLDCFEKIETYTIEESTLNLFCIKLDGKGLDTNTLQDRLLENIRYFSLSDKENSDYEVRKQTRKRDRTADKKLEEYQSDNKTSELFIFSFLEADLKAPKLFSKLEIDNSFSSVHIKIQDDNSYTLVHSNGAMNCDINKAILDSLDFISKNENKCLTPNMLMSNSIASSSYDCDTYNSLKRLIIPDKEDDELEMYNSFGVFVGFNADVKKFKKIKKGYKNHIYGEIQTMIENILGEISEKLKQKELSESEINLYLVPFEDVSAFSTEFLNSI